mgnify:CR=1 FL=1
MKELFKTLDNLRGTIQQEEALELLYICKAWNQLSKDGKIEAVEVTSAEKEDSAYLAMAEDIIPKIIEAQSAEVDTISGATFSSTGIKNAAEQALEQAVK